MLSKYGKDKRYHYTKSTADFAKAYQEEFPNGSHDKYKVFVEDFLLELRKEIIENRYVFKLPFRLGTIRIRKGKNSRNLNKNRIDWDATKKTGQLVRFLNLHTDRHYFQWKWYRKGSLGFFKNKKYYIFRPVRAATKHLHARVMECANNPELKDYDCLE